jgi:hypothetical protein
LQPQKRVTPERQQNDAKSALLGGTFSARSPGQIDKYVYLVWVASQPARALCITEVIRDSFLGQRACLVYKGAYLVNFRRIVMHAVELSAAFILTS